MLLWKASIPLVVLGPCWTTNAKFSLMSECVYVCVPTHALWVHFITTTLFSCRDAWHSSTTDVFHIHSRRANKDGAMRKEEERERGGRRCNLPYLASAYTQTKTSNDFKRERQEKNCQALNFSRDGLYGLIRTPSPTSSAFKLPTMHSHTHTTNFFVLH